jgi:hypothetical protein
MHAHRCDEYVAEVRPKKASVNCGSNSSVPVENDAFGLVSVRHMPLLLQAALAGILKYSDAFGNCQLDRDVRSAAFAARTEITRVAFSKRLFKILSVRHVLTYGAAPIDPYAIRSSTLSCRLPT